MPLSSTTCLVFLLLLFFFVFNHQNTCKLVTCEVHLRDFKMLENKKYLIGTCFGVLLLQNKFARLLKTTSWLSSYVGIHTSSVLIPRVPPCSLDFWSYLPHLNLDFY